MKQVAPVLLVGFSAAIALALGAFLDPLGAMGAEPGRNEVWRYMAPVPAMNANAFASAPAGSLTQCLWPRAVNGTAAGDARNEALAAGVGLAFCVRPPAGRQSGAGGAARAGYRT